MPLRIFIVAISTQKGSHDLGSVPTIQLCEVNSQLSLVVVEEPMRLSEPVPEYDDVALAKGKMVALADVDPVHFRSQQQVNPAPWLTRRCSLLLIRLWGVGCQSRAREVYGKKKKRQLLHPMPG